MSPARSLTLEPGRNCWRVERAGRVAFLVDAAVYFSAFRDACTQARHSITLIGWDLDGRIELVRGADAGGGAPRVLGDLLEHLVRERPGLTVRILAWDFTWIYALERDWLTPVRLGWNTSDRLIYRTDAHHPVGASHHQKIVVVDDAVAFVGGIDLGPRRWDTPAHDPEDDRRTDPAGDAYSPHHDVQAVVSGPAARALGDLARERWERAGNDPWSPRKEPDGDEPWPADLEPDLVDIDVALARTEPEHDGRDGVREVEALHLDAIDAARRSIYVENQYLTADRIVDRIAGRLEHRDGPEVVLVLPHHTHGWLEQATMDVLRDRAIERLRSADRHGRLRIVYPWIQGLGDDRLNVHAKVVVIDDRFVRVGSANLSNRSMGLDTECDLAIVADGDHDRRGIARFRRRLVAEHVGCEPDRLAEAEGDDGEGLIASIETAQRGDGSRELRRLEPTNASFASRLLPHGSLLDPERPVGVTDFLRGLVGESSTP